MDCGPPFVSETNITACAFAGEEILPGQRRSLRESNAKNLKDASSSDEDSGDDGMLSQVLLLKVFLISFQFHLRISLYVIIQCGFHCWSTNFCILVFAARCTDFYYFLKVLLPGKNRRLAILTKTSSVRLVIAVRQKIFRN